MPERDDAEIGANDAEKTDDNAGLGFQPQHIRRGTLTGTGKKLAGDNDLGYEL